MGTFAFAKGALDERGTSVENRWRRGVCRMRVDDVEPCREVRTYLHLDRQSFGNGLIYNRHICEHRHLADRSSLTGSYHGGSHRFQMGELNTSLNISYRSGNRYQDADKYRSPDGYCGPNKSVQMREDAGLLV